MSEVHPTNERQLSKHKRYYQKTREEQKAKALKYYHSKGKIQRQARNKAAREHRHVEVVAASDENETMLSNADGMYALNMSECVDVDSDDGSSEDWCDSDASVEGGLLSIDTTFLEQYQSEYWLRDEDDTVEYRIRCLDEDLRLWLGHWGGVENWPDIAADPAREPQIREQMELGVQYAKLMRQVWGARARERVVESRDVEILWERTAKMVSKLYGALSVLGVYMDESD